MIDIEESALCPLGNDPFAVSKGLIQVQGRVGDVFVDLLVKCLVLCDDRVDVDLRFAIHFRQDLVLLFEVGCDLAGEDIAIQKVDDSYAVPCGLIDICRSDAAAGGSDLVCGLLPDDVEQLVVGHDQVGVVADEEPPAHIESGRLQLCDLAQEG